MANARSASLRVTFSKLIPVSRGADYVHTKLQRIHKTPAPIPYYASIADIQSVYTEAASSQ